MFIILPLIIGACKYNLMDARLRVIFYYLILGSIFSIVTIALSAYGHNNLPFFHLYTLIEGIALLLFYRYCLKSNLNKFFYTTLLFFFIIFCLLNSFLIQSIFSFNTYSRFAEAVIIISLSLYLFYITLDVKTHERWYKNPLIFINMGLFIYFSSSLFLFLFSQLLLSDKNVNIIAWVMHASLLLAMYILFAIGFLQVKKTPVYNALR